MEMDFEFAAPSRIIFGPGKSEQLPILWKTYGVKPFFVIGNSVLRNPTLESVLNCHERAVVSIEPSIELVEELSEMIRDTGSDVIVAIGGGSVLDAGKAAGAIAPNQGSILNYLEVIGDGKQLAQDPLPMIAVPTTAGTGTEVTKNAVISSPEHKVKVSLRDQRMIPDVAVVDPELTYTLPPEITAYTGMDALTQCVEPYVSHLSTPITDPICIKGIELSSRSLIKTFQNGDHQEARGEMALASLFGGLALANAKLGAVHGFAGPIGGMFSVPHGAVCAALLLPVVEINLRVLIEREPGNPALQRYAKVGEIVSGKQNAGHQDLVEWLSKLCQALDIPGLAEYGIKNESFSEIIESSVVSSSMKGNPIQLDKDQLFEVLERAL